MVFDGDRCEAGRLMKRGPVTGLFYTYKPCRMGYAKAGHCRSTGRMAGGPIAAVVVEELWRVEGDSSQKVAYHKNASDQKRKQRTSARA